MCLSSVCGSVHTHLHTQTPVSSHPGTEGGSWSWPQLLCVSLLTHYVWQATLLLPSCCVCALPPTSFPFLEQTQTHKVWGGGGSVHSCRASENLHNVSVCLLLLTLTYYAKAFFPGWVHGAERGFTYLSKGAWPGWAWCVFLYVKTTYILSFAVTCSRGLRCSEVEVQHIAAACNILPKANPNTLLSNKGKVQMGRQDSN